jgi:hypothetical protein
MLAFINAILGAILLIAGRKIFWLMVGVIGFIAGVQVATRFFHGSEITLLIAGLVLGIIFAGLAFFVEWLAIGLAGFLGGGYILLSLAGLFGFDKGIIAIIVFVVGGMIGAALIAVLLDWALISISSLAGASLIVEAFHLRSATAGLIFFILVIIGVAIQGSALRQEQRAKAHA